MIEIIEGLPKNVVGIAVTGRVTKKDCYDVLMPAMEDSLKGATTKFGLAYYELNSRFPGAAWDNLNVGIEYAPSCERVAIVTDIGWIRYTVKALRFLIPGDIEVFARLRRLRVAPGSQRLAESPASAEAYGPARRRMPRSRRPRRRTARTTSSLRVSAPGRPRNLPPSRPPKN